MDGYELRLECLKLAASHYRCDSDTAIMVASAFYSFVIEGSIITISEVMSAKNAAKPSSDSAANDGAE